MTPEPSRAVAARLDEDGRAGATAPRFRQIPERPCYLPLVRALADDDTRFLRGAATNQSPDHNRLADCLRGKLSVHVLHTRDRMLAEGDQQIANHDARFVRGAVRLHFHDHGGSFFIALQRLAKRIG